MAAFAALTALLSGAGVLIVELTATRALAPFFGQALFVWTNVIGLVLLGLALGSIWGGWQADRRPRLGLLAALILAAAALVALAAFLPPSVSRWLLPEELPLEESYRFLLYGSFITTLVCFVPPVFLLGAVTPYLVRCSSRRLEEVGARSGQLYGASTLGSIGGTFLTTYVLLPGFGTRGTLLLAAGLLAGSALPLLLSMRRGRGTALVAGTLALAATVAGARGLPATEGMARGTLLAARDSRYQHIEIRDRPDLGARVLTLDEGYDTFQSLYRNEGVLTGAYYDAFNLLAAEVERSGSLHVLVLGLAGGTQAHQLLHWFGDLPDLEIVGVELDPAVVDLAREQLAFPEDPRLQVVSGLDGRVYVDHCRRRFDLIVVDCYSRQSYLPFHLASREFFRAARSCLRPGGILAVNLSGYGALDPVVRSVANTLAGEFPDPIACCWLPGTINFMVYAREGGPAPLPWEFADLPAELGPLAATLTPQRCWRWGFDPEGEVLTDDSGGLDRLQEVRLRDRAAALLSGDEE